MGHAEIYTQACSLVQTRQKALVAAAINLHCEAKSLSRTSYSTLHAISIAMVEKITLGRATVNTRNDCHATVPTLCNSEDGQREVDQFSGFGYQTPANLEINPTGSVVFVHLQGVSSHANPATKVMGTHPRKQDTGPFVVRLDNHISTSP
jgi:hypothetical protein